MRGFLAYAVAFFIFSAELMPKILAKVLAFLLILVINIVY